MFELKVDNGLLWGYEVHTFSLSGRHNDGSVLVLRERQSFTKNNWVYGRIIGKPKLDILNRQPPEIITKYFLQEDSSPEFIRNVGNSKWVREVSGNSYFLNGPPRTGYWTEINLEEVSLSRPLLVTR